MTGRGGSSGYTVNSWQKNPVQQKIEASTTSSINYLTPLNTRKRDGVPEWCTLHVGNQLLSCVKYSRLRRREGFVAQEGAFVDKDRGPTLAPATRVGRSKGGLSWRGTLVFGNSNCNKTFHQSNEHISECIGLLPCRPWVPHLRPSQRPFISLMRTLRSSFMVEPSDGNGRADPCWNVRGRTLSVRVQRSARNST